MVTVIPGANVWGIREMTDKYIIIKLYELLKKFLVSHGHFNQQSGPGVGAVPNLLPVHAPLVN